MSSEIQYPFFSSNLTSQDSGSNNNVLIFKQVPDFTGVGKIQVTIKGYNNINSYSLLIYLIQENDIDTNKLTFVNQIKCSSSNDLYKFDTTQNPACSYFAILVETNKVGSSPPKSLNSSDILNVAGYIDFISSAPYASAQQIQLIENGVKKWVQEQSNQTFNNLVVDDSSSSTTAVFPTNVNDFTNQLVKCGVPKNYFTQQVTFVLQLIINQANDNDHANQLLKAARASGCSITTEIQLPTKELGETESWKCLFCKAGFAITVAVAAVTIAAVVVPLIPSKEVATSALTKYLQTWYPFSDTYAGAIAGSISSPLALIAHKTKVQVKDVSLIIPQALCEKLGACQKSS